MSSATRQNVIIGAYGPAGLAHGQLYQKLRIGDCCVINLPESREEALAVADFCRRNRIHLFFLDMLIRSTFKPRWTKWKNKEVYTKRDIDEIIDMAGKYYLGRCVTGEIGQVLYGPTAVYSTEWRGQMWHHLPRAKTMGQAQNDYIKYIRQFIECERQKISKGPLVPIDAGMFFKLFCQAGMKDSDFLGLESMPGDPHLMHAAIRGAARAYGKQWGTHIAMTCYGGMQMGELWQLRFQSALYFPYISGARFIWPEWGHLTYDQHNNQRFGFQSPQMKRIRTALRGLYQFSRVHTRPAEGPLARLGIVYGNHDGFAGLWNRCVWGQYGRKAWLEGPAERGWQLLDRFFRKEDWPKETVIGDVDFSGNPPLGQYDVVPIESSPENLKKYSCLLFLGWNTMTAGIYDKLKQYVRAGGHLIMFLPHLSVEDRRGQPLRLYRNGDFSDLFGVKIMGRARQKIQGLKYIIPSAVKGYRFPFWRCRTDPRFIGNFTPSRVRLTTGRALCGYHDRYKTTREDLAANPFLVENRLGKGAAWLVTAWEYPADDMLLPFTRDLLRIISDGEQGHIRLLSSDRVRYAVYSGNAPVSGKRYYVIYLLNTDYHCPADARIVVKGVVSGFLRVEPGELRLCYVCGDLLLSPPDKMVDLAAWRSSGGKEIFDLFSVRDQKVGIHNLGRPRRLVAVNGVNRVCRPGTAAVVRLGRRIDDSRREFFAPGFLREEKIDNALTRSL